MMQHTALRVRQRLSLKLQELMFQRLVAWKCFQSRKLWRQIVSKSDLAGGYTWGARERLDVFFWKGSRVKCWGRRLFIPLMWRSPGGKS